MIVIPHSCRGRPTSVHSKRIYITGENSWGRSQRFPVKVLVRTGIAESAYGE